MKRAVLLGLLVAMTVGGCLCKKEKPIEPLTYKLCVEASQKLNWYKDKSHTLYLRLFQLSALDAFTQADPARLLEPGVVLPGMEGSPLERTVYPGTKVTVEFRLNPAAQHLGAVAGYYDPQGRVKTNRPIAAVPSDEDDDDEDKKVPCMLLGPNAIEIP